jgi:hypothetical protein
MAERYKRMGAKLEGITVSLSNKSLFLRAGMLFLFGALCTSGLSAANAQIYNVYVDTNTLASSPNGNVFAADFNLGQDALTNPSSVFVSDINLGGGTEVTPGGGQTIGTASGDLSNSISLSTSGVSTNAEFYQDFVPGSSLSFMVNTSGFSQPPAGVGASPTQFVFDIFDDNNPNIPTSLNTGDSGNFVVIALDETGSETATPYTYTDEHGKANIFVTVTPIAAAPETTSSVGMALMLGALGLLMAGVATKVRRKVAE